MVSVSNRLKMILVSTYDQMTVSLCQKIENTDPMWIPLQKNVKIIMHSHQSFSHFFSFLNMQMYIQVHGVFNSENTFSAHFWRNSQTS